MRFYKEYDENGKLIAIGCGDALNGIDISEEEYNALAEQIALNAESVEKIYRGEMSIEEVPEEWRENVQEQVDRLIAKLGPYDPEEITDEEAMDIITGVSE